MKRISKNYVRTLLREDNYMDALVYFIERLQKRVDKANTKGWNSPSECYKAGLDFTPWDEAEDEYDFLDSYIWNVARSMDDENDLEDWLANALRISSALRIALDSI